MKKTIANIIKYLVFFGTGVFFVWLSLKPILEDDAMLADFKVSLSNANFWLLVPVFFILSASHLLRALRWRLLIEPLEYKPSLPNTFFAVMIGYLANLAVPRLGEVLKCTILARYEHIPAEKSIGTIVAERAFDVLCLAIIFLLALLFQFDVIMASFTHLKDGGAQKEPSGSGWGSIIFIAIVVAMLGWAGWLLFTGKWRLLLQKVKFIFSGIWEGILTAVRLKHKARFIIYSISIWVLYIVGTWIGLYATEGSGQGIQTAISCLAMGSIGMIVSPGGLGAYAYLLAIVLKQNHVAYAIGYANGNLQWFAQFIIILLVGLTSLVLLPWYNKKTEMK